MKKDHDHAYKLLFSEPEIIIDLLQGFVHEDWVKELDFSTLEKISGSYVSDDLRSREDDVIWRVKYQQSWIYVYLLIEFQSTIDQYMAVRLMTYMGLLYQDLIKTKQLPPDKRLPPIFPVVLYNGEKRWNVATELKDLIVNLPGGLEHYLPSLKYLVLDEGAYGSEELKPLKNLVAAIFRLENATSLTDVSDIIATLLKWLTTPEQTRLRRSFSIWINRVLLSSSDLDSSTPKFNDLVEIKSMLADRIPQWIREGEQRGEARGETKGEARGETKGEASTLLKLLNLKFGTLPDRIEQQVNSADKRQLDLWVERVLTATTLDEMLF
ncbi:MAG: Rpn family recombination-promoting nuclease/putative transposase [Methylococcales bacterium]